MNIVVLCPNGSSYWYDLAARSAPPEFKLVPRLKRMITPTGWIRFIEKTQLCQLKHLTFQTVVASDNIAELLRLRR